MEDVIGNYTKLYYTGQNLFNGLVSDGANMTVLELVEKYLSLKTGVRHNTEANYKFVVNIIKKEAFGKKRIDKVKESDAKGWLMGDCLSRVWMEYNNDDKKSLVIKLEIFIQCEMKNNTFVGKREGCEKLKLQGCRCNLKTMESGM